MRFMSLSRLHEQMVTALCAVTLLLSHVMGLHQHRHVVLDKQFERHPTLLHFADAGLHHQAEHEHSGEGQDTRPYLDIESESVGDGLLKVFVDLLPALLAVGILRLPRAVVLRLPVPARTGTARRHARALRPPSQAPPSSVAA
jgi:hypothetical protein